MRLDSYLAEKGLAKSRTEAKKLIEGGFVAVNGVPVSKPSFEITDEDVSVIGGVIPYVSRGGLKLEAAIDYFSVDVTGKKCLDVGASTGGFTDCLLQHGAAQVVAVDCGHGQLDAKIASDARVTSVEGYNARNLSPKDVGCDFEICVMDVSFISQRLIHPVLPAVLAKNALFITLIKPQFELERGSLSRRGIVRSEADRKRAIRSVCESANACGFSLREVIPSPIDGGDGNIEFLALFEYKTER